jgi:hypothetical protein
MAGLGRKEWSPGDTLTAADVNGYLMDQTVMVFAGTAARASAIPTPSAGMVAYSTATQLEYYDGAAWEPVVPVAVAPGLVLVKSEVIGTAVGSVTVSDAFSATYDNYRILISDGAAPGGNVQLNLTLGATATGYSFNNLNMSYDSGTVSGTNGNATTSWVRVGRGDTNNLDAEIEIKSPFLAKRTTGQWRCATSQSISIWSVGGGYLDNATSYTAFTITPSSATLTGGTIRVYGYANS